MINRSAPMDTIISNSAADTIAYAADLATGLPAGRVLALSGELGAGKTCFVKGLAQGLGIAQAVTSPTFTLIHEYRGGRLPLVHIDLYRFDSVNQALAIGIEDYLPSRGITVIEWAERIGELLPADTIRFQLTVTGESTREIRRS